MKFEISAALKAEATAIHALAGTLAPVASETAHMIGDRIWEQAKRLEEYPQIFTPIERVA